MAKIYHVSTAVRLTLNAGIDGDKLIKKSVSVNNISDAADADSLIGVTALLGELLEYPVSAVKKYSVSLLEAD